MRRPAVGLLLASILFGGPGPAAPPVAGVAKVPAQRVAPAAIDSEASLEYFIGQASRLLKGDTSKDLAAMSSRLETLKAQKKALQQQILDQERAVAGKEAAASAQAERLRALQAQLASVESAIADLIRQIERLRD